MHDRDLPPSGICRKERRNLAASAVDGGPVACDGECTIVTGNERARSMFTCPVCRRELEESTRDAFREFERVNRRVCRPCGRAIDLHGGGSR